MGQPGSCFDGEAGEAADSSFPTHLSLGLPQGCGCKWLYSGVFRPLMLEG